MCWDERLQGWVHENLGLEMRATVDAFVAGFLTEEKKMLYYLHSIRMPPWVFSSAPLVAGPTGYGQPSQVTSPPRVSHFGGYI